MNAKTSSCRLLVLSGLMLMMGAAMAQAPKPDKRIIDCGKLDQVFPNQKDTEIKITFVNKTKNIRYVMAIEKAGVSLDQKALKPDTKLTIGTFATFPWLIADEAGKCIEIFVPDKDSSVFDLVT